MGGRKAQRAGRLPIGLVAQEPSLINDENQVGVAAGAAERIASPVLNCVLRVQDGVALFGIEREVGDVAGVPGFHEDGMGILESFGKRWLFRLGSGCPGSCQDREQKKDR